MHLDPLALRDDGQAVLARSGRDRQALQVPRPEFLHAGRRHRRDSKYNFIGEEPTPFIYQATTQVYQPQLSLFVKAAQPQAVLGTVRGEVQQLDRNLPLTGVFTLTEIFDQALWAPRMAASLLAVFAGLSLVLSVIGIYGVMAYAVSQRTRELGIRMALGASRADVLRLVVMQGLRLTLMGVGFGLAASVPVTRLIASLLYGVSPTDVVTFTIVPLLLAAAALPASYLPARDADRSDGGAAVRVGRVGLVGLGRAGAALASPLAHRLLGPGRRGHAWADRLARLIRHADWTCGGF